MKQVFAFISGRSGEGQSTIAAELAFEWVKRGASACILTHRRRIDTMGFDCFELAGLGTAPDGRRDLSALAADLDQLEDYDHFLLDLPPDGVDLAVAAGQAGAGVVVPMRVEQGSFSEFSGLFREVARRPLPQPLRLVLNQVRQPAAATEAAERLMGSVEKKLGLSTRLAAALPWDGDLAAMETSTALLGTTLPTAALVQAIPALADALAEPAADIQAPAAKGFWASLLAALRQPPAADSAPIELSEPLADGSAAAETPALTEIPALAETPSGAAAAPAGAPELAAQLDRIAAGLETLGAEVARLRRGLVAKFEIVEEGEDGGRKQGAGEAIPLDFESFRQSRGKTASKE